MNTRSWIRYPQPRRLLHAGLAMALTVGTVQGAEPRIDVQSGAVTIPYFEALFPDGELSRGWATMEQVGDTAMFELTRVERVEPITEPVADPDFPADLAVVLEDFLESLVSDFAFPGAAMRVEVGDSVWRGAAGVGRVASGEPMDYTRRFRVASQTKAMVGQVALMLVDQGVLSLDDTVADWLPELTLTNKDTILIRHLMRHQSGIFNHPDLDTFLFATADAPAAYTAPEDWVAQADAQGPLFEPGTDYTYSNTGIVVLGLIIEAATGLPIKEVLRQMLFDPLDLIGTSFEDSPVFSYGPVMHGHVHDDCAANAEECLCYADVGLEDYPFCYDGVLEDYTFYSPSFFWAAGAVASTLDDMLTFHRLRAEGALLSEATQAEMLDLLAISEITTPLSGETVDYATGLNIQVLERNARWLGHAGGIAGYSSSTLYSPQLQVGISVVANRRGAWQFEELDGSRSLTFELVPELLVLVEDTLGVPAAENRLAKRALPQAPSFGPQHLDDGFIPPGLSRR